MSGSDADFPHLFSNNNVGGWDSTKEWVGPHKSHTAVI